MNSFTRRVPKAEYSERIVLGACLVNSDVFASIVNKLTPEDFSSIRHARIWESMQELFKLNTDINIGSVGRFATQEDSSSYLIDLLSQVPSVSLVMGVDKQIQEIRNAARLRNVLTAAGKLAALAYEEKEASAAEARARTIVEELTTNDEEEALLSPARQAKVLHELIESRKSGEKPIVPTGYTKIDGMINGGMKRGDLVIVAARTSVGKSTFAENISERVAKGGHSVLFTSIEMSPDQLMYRYAVRSGMIPAYVIEFGASTEDEWALVDSLELQRSELPFHLFNAPTANVSAIRAQVSRLTTQIGQLGLVVVDYLQLMSDSMDKDSKEHLRIGMITKSLKHLAREYKVPIILISQLNRNVEYRGGEPRLADLRESGRIEEDADLILMLWQTEKPDSLGNVTKLKIEKNRQGPTGEIPIGFHKASFTFSER